MKKKFLLFSATLGIAYLGLTAYSTGPAGSSLNRTGSDGATASCTGGGCHSASGATTTGLISIREKASGTPVSSGKYVPGKKYIVTVSGTNTSGLSKFGFQATVTKADKSLAGTVTAITAATAARTVGSTTIIEHKSVLPATGGALLAEFEWMAPAKGTGTITFYGIVNAVNGTGNAAGDEPGNGFTQVFTEDLTTGISSATLTAKAVVFPNPCTNVLHVDLGKGTQTNLNILISDLGGRLLINTQTPENIDVSTLQQGIYILRIDNGTEQQVSMFTKK